MTELAQADGFIIERYPGFDDENMYVITDRHGHRFNMNEREWHTFAGLVRQAELRDMKQ